MVHSALHVDAHLPSGLQDTVSDEHPPHQPGLLSRPRSPHESKVRAARGWECVWQARLWAWVGSEAEGASPALQDPKRCRAGQRSVC